MDFGAIPLWTLENPSFHAQDAAEIHPYETAACPCGPKALKAAKRRFNHLKAEGRLNLALSLPVPDLPEEEAPAGGRLDARRARRGRRQKLRDGGGLLVALADAQEKADH